MRPNRAPMAVLSPKTGDAEDVARSWASFLDDNVGRFERTLGVPIGKRFGCGIWGCVYESKPPWAVKITRDETEGPIWALIAELLSDDELSPNLNALLRVKDVVRIRPDVVFGGEVMPVFGIVREEAIPVILPPDLATKETLRRIGVTPELLREAGISPERPSMNQIAQTIERFPGLVREAFYELAQTLRALQYYRAHALVFHRWRGLLTRRDYQGLTQDEAVELADAAFRDMLLAIEKMRGFAGFENRFGEEMGRTLLTALDADLVFQDLHLMNVGWRLFEEVEGDVRPSTMVILDPGAMATPYSPDIRAVELSENMGRYAENAARSLGRSESRERRTGRYSFHGGYDRLCTCGHRLGVHTAAAPHECIVQDFDPRYPEGCPCERFRVKRERS